MNESSKNKNKSLKPVVSAAIEQSVEAAVLSKISHMEEEVVARVIARLTPAANAHSPVPQSEPFHPFFDPLAGP
jgi:hypothetical protein